MFVNFWAFFKNPRHIPKIPLLKWDNFPKPRTPTWYIRNKQSVLPVVPWLETSESSDDFTSSCHSCSTDVVFFFLFLRSKLIIILCKARLSFQVCVSKGSHLPAHNLVLVLQKSVGEPACSCSKQAVVVVVVVASRSTRGAGWFTFCLPPPAVCRLSKTLFLAVSTAKCQYGSPLQIKILSQSTRVVGCHFVVSILSF